MYKIFVPIIFPVTKLVIVITFSQLDFNKLKYIYICYNEEFKLFAFYYKKLFANSILLFTKNVLLNNM